MTAGQTVLGVHGLFVTDIDQMPNIGTVRGVNNRWKEVFGYAEDFEAG